MALPVYCTTEDVALMLGTPSIGRDIDRGELNDEMSSFIAEAAVRTREILRGRYDPADVAAAPNSPLRVKELNAAFVAQRFLQRQGTLDDGFNDALIEQLNEVVRETSDVIHKGSLEDADGTMIEPALSVVVIEGANSDRMGTAWAPR